MAQYPKIRKSILIIAFAFLWSGHAFADMDFSILQLGSSSKQTQELLSGKGFLFETITDEAFQARKLAIGEKGSNQIKAIQPRTEFTEIQSSTSISGKFCAGKLFELNVSTYYEANDGLSLWGGRRQIYEYLQKNKAVMDKLLLSKREGDSNVGFQFIIDRSSLGGSVKGVEQINVMIDASGSGGLNLLEMRYRFTNRWFCPE